MWVDDADAVLDETLSVSVVGGACVKLDKSECDHII